MIKAIITIPRKCKLDVIDTVAADKPFGRSINGLQVGPPDDPNRYGPLMGHLEDDQVALPAEL
jgi:hypothetical protein